MYMVIVLSIVFTAYAKKGGEPNLERKQRTVLQQHGA